MSKKNLKSVLTLLDVGTSKVCCLIVKFGPDNVPEVIGCGYAPANGIQAGAIIDMEAATESIRTALSQADTQAGRLTTSVVVNISSTQMKAHHIYKETDISDSRAITGNDVRRLVDGVIAGCLADGEEVIHSFPLSYTVDKEPNIQDPRGLYASKLGVYMHIIALPESQLRNLVAALDRCHVSIDTKVATPYASALATVTEEEKSVGVTVIDFGAGTTSVAIFLNGGLIHLDLIPLGGNMLTKDITRGLNTSFSVAERLKTLHGAAFLSPRDEIERLIVPVLGEEGTNIQIPQAELISIIIPRLEEILEKVRNILQKDSYFMIAGKQLILNGGGSTLEGIKETTATFLGDSNHRSSVRIGKPDSIRGLPSQFAPYTFSTCIGLLKYVMIQERSLLNENFKSQPTPRKGFIGKVIQWLIQNF